MGLDNLQAPRIDTDGSSIAIEMNSLWLMLASGAEGNQAEKNIVDNLKSLCRMYRVPINKSKHIMIKSIRENENASAALLRSYIAWYRMNISALQYGVDNMPNEVVFPIGSVEHRCRQN